LPRARLRSAHRTFATVSAAPAEAGGTHCDTASRRLALRGVHSRPREVRSGWRRTLRQPAICEHHPLPHPPRLLPARAANVTLRLGAARG
jgi:hypothetical protein